MYWGFGWICFILGYNVISLEIYRDDYYIEKNMMI